MRCRLFILGVLFFFGSIGIAAQSDLADSQKAALQKKRALMTDSVPTRERVVKIKVDGLVCSFCAYGLEKRISELHFVETNSFGGDGVLVDLKNGVMSVALKEGQVINFGEMVKTVIQAGYVAREIHFALYGRAKKEGQQIVFQDSAWPYRFILKQGKEDSIPKEIMGRVSQVNVFFMVPKTFEDKKEIVVQIESPLKKYQETK